jgi:hypothetical protein
MGDKWAAVAVAGQPVAVVAAVTGPAVGATVQRQSIAAPYSLSSSGSLITFLTHHQVDISRISCIVIIIGVIVIIIAAAAVSITVECETSVVKPPLAKHRRKDGGKGGGAVAF